MGNYDIYWLEKICMNLGKNHRIEKKLIDEIQVVLGLDFKLLNSNTIEINKIISDLPDDYYEYSTLIYIGLMKFHCLIFAETDILKFKNDEDIITASLHLTDDNITFFILLIKIMNETGLFNIADVFKKIVESNEKTSRYSNNRDVAQWINFLIGDEIQQPPLYPTINIETGYYDDNQDEEETRYENDPADDGEITDDDKEMEKIPDEVISQVLKFRDSVFQMSVQLDSIEERVNDNLQKVDLEDNKKILLIKDELSKNVKIVRDIVSMKSAWEKDNHFEEKLSTLICDLESTEKKSISLSKMVEKKIIALKAIEKNKDQTNTPLKLTPQKFTFGEQLNRSILGSGGVLPNTPRRQSTSGSAVKAFSPIVKYPATEMFEFKDLRASPKDKTCVYPFLMSKMPDNLYTSFLNFQTQLSCMTTMCIGDECEQINKMSYEEAWNYADEHYFIPYLTMRKSRFSINTEKEDPIIENLKSSISETVEKSIEKFIANPVDIATLNKVIQTLKLSTTQAVSVGALPPPSASTPIELRSSTPSLPTPFTPRPSSSRVQSRARVDVVDDD